MGVTFSHHVFVPHVLNNSPPILCIVESNLGRGWPQGAYGQKFFDNLDTNHDGSVDSDEFVAFFQAFDPYLTPVLTPI